MPRSEVRRTIRARAQAGDTATVGAPASTSWRGFVEILPQLCFELDLDGRVVAANPAASRRLAYDPAELEGRPFLDLVRPRDRATGARRLRECLEGSGRWLPWRYRHLGKDGSEIAVRAALRRQSESGRDPGLLLVADDFAEGDAHERLVACRDCLGQMASDLAAAEERERQRIAAGLHDRVGQDLALAVLKLGALKTSWPAPAEAAVDEIRDLLKKTIEHTRSLTFELANPLLCGLGLEAALRDLALRLASENLRIDFRAPEGGVEEPEEDVSVVVYQVVRELLRNVGKHAGARTARVSLDRAGDHFVARVRDDGRGFDPRITRDALGGGFGLFKARERLHRLGGRLDIDSGPGRGSRIEVRVPVR